MQSLCRHVTRAIERPNPLEIFSSSRLCTSYSHRSVTDGKVDGKPRVRYLSLSALRSLPQSSTEALQQQNNALARAKILQLLDLDDISPEGGRTKQASVRWYNQTSPWSKDRRLSDPEAPNLEDNEEEAQKIKAEIDRLEVQLEQINLDRADPARLLEPLIQKLGLESDVNVKEILSESNDLLKAAVDQDSASEQERAGFLKALEIPTTQWSAYLRTLNINVRRAAENVSDSTIRRDLWLSYARAKAFLPPFGSTISTATWLVLFDSCAHGSIKGDPRWAPHMIELIRDMRDAGFALQKPHLMMLIEALRRQGLQEDAIKEWRSLLDSETADEQERLRHELIGVRLFTSQGDLGKAEELASAYLKGGENADSRILIPIIDTWLQRKDAVGSQHAWALYLRLKVLLGSKISPTDYDSIIMSFIRGGRQDLALSVFRDFTVAGKAIPDSLEIYRRSLGLVDEFQDAAKNSPDLNKVSLIAMTVMPRAYQNKFFYGSWIKKLINFGEVDAAASVAELMYERGLTPAPKHINGIIAAWFKSHVKTQGEKAEQLAWAMIQQRILFVQDRLKLKAMPSAEKIPIKLPNGLGKVAERCRNVPVATIETFSILLYHYLVNGKYDEARHLQDTLSLAEIKPNSYWCNHLMYSDLHQRQPEQAWQRHSLNHIKGIKPDLQTFTCLWECEMLAIKQHVQFGETMPTPRLLMKETIQWLKEQSPQNRGNIRETFPAELYQLLIQCMFSTRDIAAAVVSVFLFRDVLGLYPCAQLEKAVRHYTHELIGPTRRTRIMARRTSSRSTMASNELLTALNLAIRKLEVNRRSKLGQIKLETISKDAVQEERLFLLGGVLRTVMEVVLKMDPEQCDIEIHHAALEMGFPELEIVDPLDRM